MLTRDHLREAYALADRERTRLRSNFIESVDGAVTLHGRSGPLGGANDRAVMGVLRAMADIVLVGAGTTKVEGYGGLSLDAEDTRWRLAQALTREPRLAIVSRRLELSSDAPVFTEAADPPLIVTCASSPADRRDELASVAEVIVCGEDTVDLAVMLRLFAQRGWTQVLCEGGPHLFGALLAADLVDEACVTISPHIVGGDAGRMVRGANEAERPFTLAGSFSDDEGFVFLRYAAARLSASNIV